MAKIADADGERRRAQQPIAGRAPALLALGTFITSLVSPVLAFAQSPEDSSTETTTSESSQPPPAPADDSSATSAATVDTSSTAEAETDEKSQDALLDHIKDEAGIEGDSSEGETMSLDGVGRANVTLPTADNSGVTGKQISIPKGEGTIKGMEESFSMQLSTGTATFSVPFALPAARGKAQPALSLSYNSASGLGAAGMGWSMGVPFIARQTDRGLPKYDDRVGFHPEQDHFVFNGGQELVPICTVGPALECAGALHGLAAPPGALDTALIDEAMPEWAAGWQYFRPRVEGSFLRFFWSPSHETWRVQDQNGITMELGVPLNDATYRTAVEVNPDHTNQIYRWHLVRQYDLYGETQNSAPMPKNVIVYRYLQDGGQAYVTDIFGTPPAINAEFAPLSQYAQHTRIVYEPRSDVTRSYRNGWLTLQTLRAKRVDVSSKSFTGDVSSPRELLRRYHLRYDDTSHITLLESVQVEGRCDDTTGPQILETDNQALPATSCPRLPPMQFEYSRVSGYLADGTPITSSLAGYEPFDERVLTVNHSPPHSIDEQQTTLMDVNGDSLTDVLVTAAGVYGGKHGVFFNGGSGVVTGFEEDRIGILGVLGANANVIKLGNLNVVPLDADGDGLANLLHMPMVKTYAMYDPIFSNGSWNWVGREITAADNNNPKVDFGHDTRDIKVLDVDFDGLVDVVASQGTEFQTFFALGRYPKGDGQFGYATRTGKESATISNNPVRMCVPWRGTPLRLSDSDTELADMNGDGITDIVRIRRGDIHYWPGRGNGYWGTGDLNNCPEGSFDQNGDLAMEEGPFYTDIQGTSLRLDDVNGDGLSDLVQVNFDDVSVWLNVNGTGWTDRYIIDNTPESPAYANRVRLVDVNASGTLDIVWGDANNYRYIDLAGGVRPHLLRKVSNGLGKTSEIEYGTSAQEMLDAKDAGKEWASAMPTLIHVIKRVIEKDNLTIAGRPPASYVTEYTYRDPVYEGRQREFRGFREAEARKIGDANSPTSITRSVFLLGECRDETSDNIADCSNPERWRDNPREALKGLPVVTETRSENGIYLSTTHNKYALRHLYDGLDGRAVRYAFLSDTDNYLYDTANFDAASSSSTAPVASVETRDGNAFTVDGDIPGESISLNKRSSAGAVHTHTATTVDAFGNQTQKVADGVIGQDEQLTSTSVPVLIDEPSHWLWRTSRTFLTGDQHGTDPDFQVRNDTQHSYSAQGDLTTTMAELHGTLPLARLQPDGVTHPQRSVDATITLAVNTYDGFGNLLTAKGAGQRASAIGYDDRYEQLRVQETVYVDPQNLGDADADSTAQRPLITEAEYDRGLGIVTVAEDANQQPTAFVYDTFGRLIELYRPVPQASTPALSPKPSLRIQYFLPPVSGPHHSIIHTETQDGMDLDDESYLESWGYVDGLGRTIVTLSEAEDDPNATQATAQRWIVGNLSEWDQKNALRRKYLEFFYQGDPMAFNFGTKPNGPYGRQRYDAFGRQFQTFDVDGTVTLESRYHALSTDLWDAADLEPGGTHAASFASETKDGHGRTIETAERFRVDSTMETRYTRTEYLPTGKPEVIRRVRRSTQEETSRWFVYDSLGRMVLNVEPHSSVDYALNANPNQSYATDYSGVTAWRYAYNNAGDLVGTSDARGCGSNYFYDGAGRLTGEDFFSCDGENMGEQPNYSEPAVDVDAHLTGDGLEVFYEYDSAATNNGCSVTQTNLQGRLSRVRDQARITLASYDGRGRGILTAIRIAKPDIVENALADRYTDRCYRKVFTYDAADRPLTESTGAQVHLNENDESAVSYQYSRRGDIATVQSSYGPEEPQHQGTGGPPGRYLVSDIIRTADDRVEKIEYGDLARTATTYTYDDRRRVQSVVTSRAPPSAWPDGELQSPHTFQLSLQDEEYTYDVVNNPTEIRDWRIPDEWPEGAKPVSKKIDYDDLYRASRVSYEYATGDDDWHSPYEAENASSLDPRRAKPSPHVSFAKRILWQSYRYDWLGNQNKTDDDTKGFYDRSLGTVVNGEEDGSEDKVPYQLKSASQPGAKGGRLWTHYDSAGNLTRLLLDRDSTGADCLGGTSCDQWFEYTWDEVGRLSRARRWDGVPFTGVDADTSAIPGGTPAADLSYRYDADDNRVLKTATDTSNNQSHAVYIFASLELRGTTFNVETADDYHLDAMTEVIYLFAHGVRLARIHFEETVEPSIWTPAGGTPNTRIFFELGDHLGSTSVVLDKASSELVQRSTFQAYGGSESDYRSSRWKNFREDYRFTGKEEDVEVGLQYFGKRYLNPLLERWVSADPLTVHAAGADLNLYAYVSGQVLKNVDPLGLMSGSKDPKASAAQNAGRHEAWQRGENDIVAAETLHNEIEKAQQQYRDEVDIIHGYAPMGQRAWGGQLVPVDCSGGKCDAAMAKAQASLDAKIAAAEDKFSKTYIGLQPGMTKEEQLSYRSAITHHKEMKILVAVLTTVVAPELAAASVIKAVRLIRGLQAVRAGIKAAEAAAKFGRAASTDYRATFFAAHPELKGKVVVHHAVEQQVLTRYPGVVSEAEIHSLENLRGIPKAINSDVHLSKIRVEWNQFYRANPNPTKAQLLQKATEIDAKFGSQFTPPR